MNWETLYRSKVTDADTALAAIQSGDRIYVGGGAGVPKVLINRLAACAANLRDVEVTHILTFAEAPYADARYAEKVFVRTGDGR